MIKLIYGVHTIMELNQESLVSILDNLHGGLYIVKNTMEICFWNKAAENISGFSSKEMVGTFCSDNRLNHVDDNGKPLCYGACPLTATLKDGVPREAQVYLHHKGGYRIPVWVRTSALIDNNGQLYRGIEMFSDNTNQNANILRVQELEKLAFLDKLTQLANRYYIEKELFLRFEEKKRLHVPFGILFMDIDHFKVFNDTYGHDIGDKVLRYVAKTFTTNTRAYDILGRWGGEEFIAIIRNISEADLVTLGNTLKHLIENSFIMHNNINIHVTISIGATMVRSDDTVDSLIKRADSLMYQSKKNGRNKLTLG
jgi:diguanylate cyclase (GGDEF)-like protein/PAS domain S-box-containing protein